MSERDERLRAIQNCPVCLCEEQCLADGKCFLPLPDLRSVFPHLAARNEDRPNSTVTDDRASGTEHAVEKVMTNNESSARQMEINKAQIRRDEAAQRLCYEAGFKCDIGAAMQDLKAADEALDEMTGGR